MSSWTGLEGFLGKPIARLNPDRDFDFWAVRVRKFLAVAPNTLVHSAELKLRPLEHWLRDDLESGTVVRPRRCHSI